MSFVVLDSDAAVPKNLDKRYLSEDKKTVKAEDRTIHCHKIRAGKRRDLSYRKKLLRPG
ncbi:hypothetical protein SNOG_13138 [Parastagonospora nodorum SN15]|uniref:Uncharacterized protein n=1 Tax=Phaeosphaeria nodorum (strain SN15 / ATCC MYA-4574 / FGSC 10173) TaxID=321614 RepID=Q0U526_PHANO|nr:hypothetical protein SNOG_13138 [Parastagonospora nodorum SN15]EAT79465.1 hypothetical protein SNOG_13138 [Parastagonospora nodorum SN15]